MENGLGLSCVSRKVSETDELPRVFPFCPSYHQTDVISSSDLFSQLLFALSRLDNQPQIALVQQINSNVAICMLKLNN